MMPGLNHILRMVGRTIRSPREGAEEVLALGVPKEALWTIFALVIVLSVILTQITAMIVGVANDPAAPVFFTSPVASGLIQIVLLTMMVAAVQAVGRAFGGTGQFPEALLLVTWLQFIMVCLQVAQTLALIILPPLAQIIGMISLVLFLWLLTNFVAVLHGFRSLAQVFVMILVSAFGFAFVATLILAILGVPMPTAPGGGL